MLLTHTYVIDFERSLSKVLFSVGVGDVLVQGALAGRRFFFRFSRTRTVTISKYVEGQVKAEVVTKVVGWFHFGRVSVVPDRTSQGSDKVDR